MAFIIAQILGIINTILCIVMMQFKKASSILIGQVASNLIISISFLLLGGNSGAWICIAAAIQSVIMYFIDRFSQKNTGKKRKILLGIFLIVYIVGTIVFYQSWHDIFSGICAVLFVFSIVQKEAGKMRNFTLANSACWLVYDVATMAYTSIFTHLGILISTIIAKFRLDRKPKVKA